MSASALEQDDEHLDEEAQVRAQERWGASAVPACAAQHALNSPAARGPAQALLKELASSQAEVKRMLDLQQEQAVQLGGLKAQLAAEVRAATAPGPHSSRLAPVLV